MRIHCENSDRADACRCNHQCLSSPIHGPALSLKQEADSSACKVGGVCGDVGNSCHQRDTAKIQSSFLTEKRWNPEQVKVPHRVGEESADEDGPRFAICEKLYPSPSRKSHGLVGLRKFGMTAYEDLKNDHPDESENS